MAQYIPIAGALIIAYLLGSIPTALIVSRRAKKTDIRRLGDGNMGAHNSFHELGPGYGVLIAVIDIAKGAMAVFLAGRLGLDLPWRILASAAVIAGHDFPLFAGFKGGQGTATSFGTMLVLFPVPALIGLGASGLAFSIIRNFNLACAIGGATVALAVGLTREWLLLVYVVGAFLFIPLKLLIDSPRRRTLGQTR